MTSTPQPHVLEFAGPQYAPIETLPLEGCTWELQAGSTKLAGTASIQIPDSARSVLIEAMTADVRFRSGNANTVTISAPAADVTDGSAGGWLPAGASNTYSVDKATWLALKSAGGVRLTWFA